MYNLKHENVKYNNSVDVHNLWIIYKVPNI